MERGDRRGRVVWRVVAGSGGGDVVSVGVADSVADRAGHGVDQQKPQLQTWPKGALNLHPPPDPVGVSLLAIAEGQSLYPSLIDRYREQAHSYSKALVNSIWHNDRPHRYMWL
ncbi:hypothetical protein EMIT0232MI5_10674 [Pseudomonas sp. IT-232MI5]